MDAQYWLDRWDKGQIGFHEGAPNRWLEEHVAMLGPGAGRRVLVPLCGKSIDLAFLAACGFEVVGVELAGEAAAAFFEEADLTPTRTESGGFARLVAGPITIVVGDFFALREEHVGTFHAFYDRAAVVALPRELRTRYSESLRARLASDAVGLVITFEHDGPTTAPPFSVDAAEVARVWPDFERVVLGGHDVLGERGTLREAGATFATENAYALRRVG